MNMNVIWLIVCNPVTLWTIALLAVHEHVAGCVQRNLHNGKFRYSTIRCSVVVRWIATLVYNPLHWIGALWGTLVEFVKQRIEGWLRFLFENVYLRLKNLVIRLKLLNIFPT